MCLFQNGIFKTEKLNKKVLHILLLIFVLTAVSHRALAQKASVQATVQPTEISIGEQALINLKVLAPKDMQIQFPVYESHIVDGVEVLTMLPPDTTIENNVMTLQFKYIVTSFDSTLYHIPGMPVFDGKDTIMSNSFGLKVISPQLSDSTLQYLQKLNQAEVDSIDFRQLQLNDIKPIQKPPFVWTDYLWVLWILLGIVLLVLLIGVIIFLVLRKKKKGYFFQPPVVQPPHVRAIEALDRIKSEKLWQQPGREKEFYTKLTDVLRVYLEERFGVNALEMTSGEILDKISQLPETDSVHENLKQILATSDLVKFAKYKPFMDESDLSIANSYLFINQTREAETTENDRQTGKENQNSNRADENGNNL